MRIASLVKLGNSISDGIVFVFTLLLNALEGLKSQATVAFLDSFQEVNLEW